MNNQNFYLRLIALLLIIMAVFFYNGTVKDKEQAQDIADLTAKTESLEKQQDQILTALKETYEEQKTASESNASSDVSSEADNKSEKDSVSSTFTLLMLLMYAENSSAVMPFAATSFVSLLS